VAVIAAQSRQGWAGRAYFWKCIRHPLLAPACKAGGFGTEVYNLAKRIHIEGSWLLVGRTQLSLLLADHFIQRKIKLPAAGEVSLALLGVSDCRVTRSYMDSEHKVGLVFKAHYNGCAIGSRRIDFPVSLTVTHKGDGEQPVVRWDKQLFDRVEFATDR